MSDLCLKCNMPVTSRQQALQCDGCDGWQHRKCGTGITQGQYREAVRSEGAIDWKCTVCSSPPTESSHNSDDFATARNEFPNDVSSLFGDPTLHTSMDIPVLPVPSWSSSIANGPSFDSSSHVTPDEVRLEAIENQEQASITSSIASHSEPSPVPLPDEIEESSIVGDDLTIKEKEVGPEVVTYERIEEASKQRRVKLVDSRGYTYNVKEKGKNGATYWQCSVRTKQNYCRATLREVDGSFIPGKQGHDHPAEVGTATAAKIVSEVKRRATGNLFKPASAIVEEVLTEKLTAGPCPALSKPDQIARAANSLRQNLRPDDPRDLSFDIRHDCLPENFLQADVTVKSRRHLIFASSEQLTTLSKARTWYIDGTFKQLMTVNAFVRSGDCAKQVPLVFVVMSGHKKSDYKKVLKKILDVLPSSPEVKKVVMDFEKATWSAVKSVLPEVSRMGCVFHWSQAVWRKVQELGLTLPYESDEATYRFIRKLLALPFLPATEIERVFDTLKQQATTGQLQDLVQYINDQWVTSATFPPEEWSVYGQAIRTNNDVEGWHNGLNRRASGRVHLPFYLLIELLKKEADLVNLQMRLVADRKLKRIQRKKYRELQAKLMCQWEDYSDGRQSVFELLRACSHLYGPVRGQ